ncbi:hypothetical protein LC593_07665 [Nostoc sp. CHAB 5844]|nr:hypothetical protein [Nostoc sp. CHAB 5844]
MSIVKSVPKIERVMLMGNRLLARNIFNFLYYENEITPLVIVNFSDQGIDNEAGVSLLKTVQEKNVKYCQPKNINQDEKVLKLIQEYSPQIAISCSYEKILTKKVLNLVKNHFFNFHYSLLPRHRGCYPIIWAIASSDPEIGVTLHQMSTGIDDGNIINQASIPLVIGATAKDMYNKCAEIGTNLFKEVWEILNQGNSLPSYPQSPNKVIYHTLRYPFDRWIPWYLSATKVASIINSLTFFPNPSGRSIYNDNEIGILGPSFPKISDNCQPGLIKKRDDMLTVDCLDGYITFDKVRQDNALYSPEMLLHKNHYLYSPVLPEYNP